MYKRQEHKYNTAEDWQAFQDQQKGGLQGRADKYNQYGSELNWRVQDDKLRFGDEGNTIYSDVRDIADDSYSQILNFENGLRGWETLDQGVKDWYLSQYDPSSIVAGQDEWGNTWSVADITPITDERIDEINTAQQENVADLVGVNPNLNPDTCLLYTSPSPRDS